MDCSSTYQAMRESVWLLALVIVTEMSVDVLVK